MRLIYLLAAILILPLPAYAQLAGTDTTPGSSCAGFPTGATRLTADAGNTGVQVTLICNGSTWEQEGLVAVSKAGDPPAADGGSGSSVWSLSGSDTYYDSGNVGIGDTNPSVALDVVGDIHYTGVIVDVSDIRMKYDVQPIQRPLQKLTSLDGFSFKMKEGHSAITEYGVSAQDVQKVFPELVHKIDAAGTLGVSYDGLIAPLIEAMKEQQKQIEALQVEIEILKSARGLPQNNSDISTSNEL